MNEARSPDQIERDITDLRERISDTLDAVQDRLSPGQVLDQLLTYSKDGGNALIDACARAIGKNPLPATLLGFSLAWLLYSNSRPEPVQPDLFEDARDQARAGLTWTRDEAERARDAGQTYIKSNPFAAAAIAIGVGALIGALLPPHGGEDDREDRRSGRRRRRR